ncbi:MAG: SprB repeat-containing protein [Bacteroidetes bacterium]|nr:SprB repeat-containing protein [Bacteroidota bacterium]
MLTTTQQTLTMVSCHGGSNGTASFSAAGGTAPYTYSWSNGAVTANTSGLIAGTYNLTVTDDKGCVTTSSVLITEPAAILFNTPSITNVSCFNGNNGQLSVSNSGGLAPYAYQWSTGSTNAVLNNLAAGADTVTVTDANSCTETRTMSVLQPDAISIQSAINAIPCFGMNNAAITVNTSGGVAPYSYVWNNGANTNAISSLSPGTYSIIITDANNCVFDTTYTITQPTALQAAGNPDTICIGQAAVLNAVVNGGTPSYSYEWSNSNSNQFHSGQSCCYILLRTHHYRCQRM